VHQYDAAVAAGTSWIDRAVGPGAHVAVLWSGGGAIRIWENEFWNRSVRRVYDLGGATLPGSMPQTQVTVQRETGTLVDARGRPVDGDYVLTDESVEVLGQRIARDHPHGLVLYKVQGPARLVTRITGWYGPPDGWTSDHVVWSRAECKAGTLRIPVYTDPALFHDVVQRIAITGTTTARTFTLRPTQTRLLVIPLTPRNGHCTVDLRVTPSRVPAKYPRLHLHDTRLLGVHASRFAYTP